MAGLAAAGRFRKGADGVVAAGRAGRELVVTEIRPQGRAGWSHALRLFVLQGPLLFGSVDLAEVVDAGIFLRGAARFDKVGNGNGREHSDWNGGAQQEHLGRVLIAVAN